MILRRCDQCQREVKTVDSVSIAVALKQIDLCQSCAQPLVELLQSQQLLVPAPKSSVAAG